MASSRSPLHTFSRVFAVLTPMRGGFSPHCQLRKPKLRDQGLAQDTRLVNHSFFIFNSVLFISFLFHCGHAACRILVPPPGIKHWKHRVLTILTSGGAGMSFSLSFYFCFFLSKVIGHMLGDMFSSVQLLSCVWLFATPWTAAHQASLSITSS